MSFMVLLGIASVLAWSQEAGRGAPSAMRDAREPELPETAVDMVPIAAGSFLMGSPETEKERFDDEGPVHDVDLSAFECMRYPVTRRLFAEVMGKDPSWPEGAADDRPVNRVSWYDAVRFCNELSFRDGLSVCYVRNGDFVFCDWQADGYRLPTEAEWEYACRAGTKSRWHCGDDPRQLHDFAWFSANTGTDPPAAGAKSANAWGLHDMHGNVLEWCWDRHAEYEAGPQTDPRGPEDRDPGGLVVAARGGSFVITSGFLRSAYRGRAGVRERGGGIGFRCVRVPRR